MNEARTDARTRWGRRVALSAILLLALGAGRFYFQPSPHQSPPGTGSYEGHPEKRSDLPRSTGAPDTGNAPDPTGEAPTGALSPSPGFSASEELRAEPVASVPSPFVPPAAPPAGQRRPRIAVVDLHRLFDAHPLTKSTQTLIDQRRTSGSRESALPIESGDPEAAARHRDAREKELQQESVRTREQIVSDLQKRITAAAIKGDFDFVLDLSGKSLNAVPVILHASGFTDLTDDILRELSP